MGLTGVREERRSGVVELRLGILMVVMGGLVYVSDPGRSHGASIECMYKRPGRGQERGGEWMEWKVSVRRVL